MQPFQCDLPPQLQEPHRTTHTDTTTRCKTHRRNNSRTKRPQPHPSHRRGTFHRRLQPLDTEKHKVSCSGFLPTTKPMQHSCSHSNAICHSSPLPIVTTSLPHHFPSSPLPFLTTSHRHHFPSSSLPIVSNSIASHFPSSSLPIATTSLPHHFPSSPLPFLTTPLHHHFPSSPLPFLTTSLPHHFPSSPLPAITTSLPHHFRNSEVLLPNFLWLCIVILCIVIWSTTLPQGQFHCFLFFCDVLVHYVLLHDLPPFIIVNCTK